MSLLSLPGRLLIGLSALFAVAALFVSPGFFTIDEVVYMLGADAFARGQGYVVDNGYSAFGSDALKIWFLQPGVDGLVSQYPAGTAWAGALLLSLFGAKGLIALNVAAGIATLFATRALALALFGSETVALGAVALLALASFWPEYLFGHWPHAVSVLCTTLALVFVLRALPREAGALGPAALAGLAIGVGLLFRLDGVLVTPGVAVVTILWAARPMVVLAGGALGLAPGVALLAAVNHAKFGSWNPLSYGVSGGGTDLSGHAATGAALVVGLALLVALRFLPPLGRRVGWALVGVVAAGLVVAFFTPLAPYLWRLLRGVQAILLDASTITDPRPGVQRQPDGTLLFWGLPKKALLQSLPWLGALGVLVGARGVPWRPVGIVLIVSVLWALPFLALSWHGGLGSNMRYLMPTLPGLAALGAWALVRLVETRADGVALLRYGVGGALVIALSARLAVPGMEGLLHQLVPTWVFAAVLALSIVAALVTAQGLRAGAVLVAGAGVGLGLYLAGSDLVASQERRAWNAAVSRASAELPGPAIFYGPPETFAHAIGAPERHLALPFPPGGDGPLDPALAEAACAAGARIVMWDYTVPGTGLPPARFEALTTAELVGGRSLVALTCD